MHNISRVCAAALLAASTACAVPTGTAPGGSYPAPTAVSAGNADELLPVDCLLPAQVRKMGQRLTMLTPRRPTKTVAVDCEIRGGEYVAYDRANYSTALNVWKADADQGDPKAQNYVGEIHERGLGIAPDHRGAAGWYRKSADQGYAPAMINLGQLYEQGLGVEKDVATALSWYRRASGLAEVELPFVTDLTQKELVQLRQDLGQSQKEAGALRSQLASAQRNLRRSQQAKAKLEATATGDRERLENSRIGLKDQQQLANEKRRQLEAERDRLASEKAGGASSQVLAQFGERVKAREAELGRLDRELDARAKEMNALESSYASRRDRIRELDAEIATLAQKAEERRSTLASVQPQSLLAVAGPSIQMIDPALSSSLQRGNETVTTPVRRRPVVGRAEAAAGLMSLLVNDREIGVSNKGIFRTEVAVADGGTDVRVVAIDEQGKRAERTFRLSPGEREETSKTRAVVPSGVEFGRYHALVIGNNKYQHLPDLETARSDAKAVSDVLRNRYGFKVMTLYDATRYQILTALNTMRAELNQKDNLLIYYAGHGELDKVNQRGFWLPVDAERESTANWVSNIQLTDVLNSMNAKHVMVVADSCYSGALTRSALARIDAGLTRDAQVAWQKKMATRRTRVALTSGGLKPVLDGGGGSHSIFARAFLDVLTRNAEVLEGARLAHEISALVSYAAEASDFDQLPQYAPIKYAGHESGDFFFVPRT